MRGSGGRRRCAQPPSASLLPSSRGTRKKTSTASSAVVLRRCASRLFLRLVNCIQAHTTAHFSLTAIPPSEGWFLSRVHRGLSARNDSVSRGPFAGVFLRSCGSVYHLLVWRLEAIWRCDCDDPSPETQPSPLTREFFHRKLFYIRWGSAGVFTSLNRGH